MKITTDHPASRFGFPVVLNDEGLAMSPAKGIQLARERLGLSRENLASRCGYESYRSIEGLEHGRRKVPANVLNVLADLLAKREKEASDECSG